MNRDRLTNPGQSNTISAFDKTDKAKNILIAVTKTNIKTHKA